MRVTFQNTNERAGIAILLTLLIGALPLGWFAPTEVQLCASAAWALGVLDWLVFGYFLYRWRLRHPYDVPFHLHMHGFYARLIAISLGVAIWTPYSIAGSGAWVLAFIVTHLAAQIAWGLTPVPDPPSPSATAKAAATQAALDDLRHALSSSPPRGAGPK